MARSPTVVLLVIGCGLTGCDVSGPTACTNLGCETGLHVELEGQPQGAFSITADSPGGESRVIECTEVTTGCPLVFVDYTPAEVMLTYESADVTVHETFTPTYALVRPNGPGCSPECLTATVVLQLN